MKNNTNKARNLLEQALLSLPQDFSLDTARRSIKIALSEIIQIENKREKRNKLKENRKELKNKLMPSSIKIIDELIKQENKKIENNKNKKENEDIEINISE
jgi:hypothetical protein